jgi:putative membrane protein
MYHNAAMSTAALAATLVVAALHVVFMILESVLWTTPTGRKIFAQTKEGAEATKVLALNQGIYNGGVAALLGWAAFTDRSDTTVALLIFVIAMGIVGAITAKPTILLFQAVPAGAALGLTLL